VELTAKLADYYEITKLKSKMISTQASTTSSLPLRLTVTATAILRPSSAFLHRSRSHQQTRSFRFGLWSSYLDHDFEKEYRRRHKVFKHKYIEALNRKLSWDRHLPGSNKTYGLNTFMYSAWNNRDSRPGGRWVNVDELRTPREEPVNERYTDFSTPTKKHAISLLRFQQQFKDSLNGKFRRGMAGSNINHMSGASQLGSTGSPSVTSTISEMYSTEGFRRIFQSQENQNEIEYEIDPITNRKVYKVASKKSSDSSSDWTNIPVKKFEGYSSHFQRFEPPISASEGPEGKLCDSPRRSTREDDPIDPVQEGLEVYDSKANYSHGALYDVSRCNIDYRDSIQAGLKDHDEKLTRKSCQFDLKPETNNPAIASHNPSELVSQDPDEVHKAIRQYEYSFTRPEGLLRAIKEYEGRRPGFPEGLFGRTEKVHPLVQAIEDFERNKLETNTQPSCGQMLDPLLESIQQYRKGLYIEKLETERQGTETDRRLLDVLKPIDEYTNYLSAARLSRGSVEDGLKDYDSKVDYSRGRRNAIFNRSSEETKEDLDLLRASDIRAASGIIKSPRHETEAEKSSKRKELEQAFIHSESLAEEEMAALNKVKESRRGYTGLGINPPNKASRFEAPTSIHENGLQDSEMSSGVESRKLTGNFTHDFPEDFETTWREHESGGLMPKFKSVGAKDSSALEAMPSTNRTDEELRGKTSAPRMETSLDRVTQQPKQEIASDRGQKDMTGSSLQGKGEVSQSISSSVSSKGDRSRRAVLPGPSVVEKRHSTIQHDDRTFEHVEPTIYRILAYDPTMQSVSSAETTSIVEDLSTPLTPSEVLLRLSNPAKFFPHFQTLQSQGYEIVSGSGDVLVFRKVRSGSPFKTESRKTETAAQIYRRNYTNPIDGMQGNPIATTGNFASPTGFVNHDLPRDNDTPFKSNIDVRRAEPVFSGRSNWQGESKEIPRKKGRGPKVLISAVWVAGCCYAVGVVAEFFRTGGADGIGPQGF
jgi:hypothetical protein